MLILIPFLTVLLYIYPYNKQLIKHIIRKERFPSKEIKEIFPTFIQIQYIYYKQI